MVIPEFLCKRTSSLSGLSYLAYYWCADLGALARAGSLQGSAPVSSTRNAGATPGGSGGFLHVLIVDMLLAGDADLSAAVAARAQLRHLRRHLTSRLVHRILPLRPGAITSMLDEVLLGAGRKVVLPHRLEVSARLGEILRRALHTSTAM
jgi:hypothetical protein